MRARGPALLLVALLALAAPACERPGPTEATTLADDGALLDALRLPKSGFAPVLGIEDRKRFVDDVGAPPPASDRAHREFRELGLRAASSHKYKLKAGRTPSRYTVRINLYVDTRAAADGWERRYPPEERERGAALSLGDQGFQLDGWIRAFRVGRALIEIEGGGEAAPIDAFAAAYARHVETLRMRLQ